jgi:hypothetical protein
MDRAAADALLATVNELIPAAEGAIPQARELERRLLAEDIPVALARPPPRECCGGGGCACGTKLQLLVREEDVPRLSALLHADWMEAVAQEGTVAGPVQALVTGGEGSAEELACPACGFKGPLVEGACGDCGLQLE